MSLIEQKTNVCHVSATLKHVTVSFRSMKASRLYLKWMQFPQTFYVWIFNVNRLFCFFLEIFVRQKCLVFFCVCTCTNLLVLNTEVKNVMYMNSIAMGQINQCWFQSYVVMINNVYLYKINTFELSWVEIIYIYIVYVEYLYEKCIWFFCTPEHLALFLKHFVYTVYTNVRLTGVHFCVVALYLRCKIIL